MISIRGLILILVLTFLSCSSTKYSPKFYSRAGFSLNQLSHLYEKVPYFQDSLVHKFIVELKTPDVPEETRKAGIAGTVVCHPLIDEDGNVEAVYIKQPLNPVVDQAVIEAVKKSEFKTYSEVSGQRGKYSLVIPFSIFYEYEKDLDYFFKRNPDADK